MNFAGKGFCFRSRQALSLFSREPPLRPAPGNIPLLSCVLLWEHACSEKVFVDKFARMILLCSFVVMCASQLSAQANSAAPIAPPLESIQSQAELDKAITALDTALFDAYNQCDLDKFSSFFADDVEFYHD